jgi:uncharacterized cupin superfamily protein
VIPEAPLEQADAGLVASGEGWFILNARDARWFEGDYGAYTRLGEGEIRFEQIGINIGVAQPGQPACMYHREANQEDFLVLCGECLLLVEGEERRLKQWDFVHCPPWTDHVFVGAGNGPCAVLAVGSRAIREVVYPESELARKHRAGVPKETNDPREAYAKNNPDTAVAYREGFLPDFEKGSDPGGV